MGSSASKILLICRSNHKKNPANNTDPKDVPNNGEGDGQVPIEDFDDGGLIEGNRDNYFHKDDFEKIGKKFPNYKEWMNQSSLASSKTRPRQKKIKWKEGEIIGTGSFGRVIMGLNLQTGSIMAVKQVQIGASNTQAQQERIKALEIEIELLSQLSHKNIVRYYGSNKTKTTFNIFLEYISGGTIASLIEKYGPLNENLVRVYTRQILEGLEYLHVRNTIHRDIKGANVLVDNSGTCKLADFGTAKRISSIIEGEMRHMPSIRGTVNWMAPEVIKQTSLGRYSDIWSVGCTVLEMLTGKMPWSQVMKPYATPLSALYQIASAQTHPPLPSGLSPEATDFLKQCFRIKPTERPNVINLLNHRFLMGAETIEKPLPLNDADKAKSIGKSQVPPSSARHKKSESTSLKTNEKWRSPKGGSSFSKGRRDSNINIIGMLDEAEHTRLAETLENTTKEDKKGEKKIENKELNKTRETKKEVEKSELSKQTEDQEEKLPEMSNRHKFRLRSLADVHNNSANFEGGSRPDSFIEEKGLKGERTVSHSEAVGSPVNFGHHFQYDRPQSIFSQMRTGTLREDTQNDKEATPNQRSRSRLNTLEIEVGAGKEQDLNLKVDPVPISHRKSKNRPLGKNDLTGSFRQPNQSIAGEEEFNKSNASIEGELPIRKVSDQILPEINPYQTRARSQFGLKEPTNSNEKESLVDNNSKEIVNEENNQEEEAKPEEERESELEDQIRSPEKKQIEENKSPSKDSDIESSTTYQYQQKILSSSIKTINIPEVNGLSAVKKYVQNGEGSEYKRKEISPKYSPARNIANAISEVQIDARSNSDSADDFATGIRFTGIQLAESLVTDKQANVSNIEEENNQIPQIKTERIPSLRERRGNFQRNNKIPISYSNKQNGWIDTEKKNEDNM